MQGVCFCYWKYGISYLQWVRFVWFFFDIVFYRSQFCDQVHNIDKKTWKYSKTKFQIHSHFGNV